MWPLNFFLHWLNILWADTLGPLLLTVATFNFISKMTRLFMYVILFIFILENNDCSLTNTDIKPTVSIDSSHWSNVTFRAESSAQWGDYREIVCDAHRAPARVFWVDLYTVLKCSPNARSVIPHSLFAHGGISPGKCDSGVSCMNLNVIYVVKLLCVGAEKVVQQADGESSFSRGLYV